MDFQAIDQQAANLFVLGADGLKTLHDAWNVLACREETRYAYPEIPFHVAKIHINEGNFYQADLLLDGCEKAWQDQPEQLARVDTLRAFIALQEQDYERGYKLIKQVRAASQNATLLSECHYLEAEIFAVTEPTQALKSYNAALQIQLGLRSSRPDVADHDITRITLRAASVALEQNMRTIGWHYQRRAEEAARHLKNPTLLAWVLIKTGNVLEMEGDYERAIAAYQEATALCHNEQLLAQLQMSRMRIALLTWQDWLLQELCQSMPQIEHPQLMSQYLLLQAWIEAFQYNLTQAVLHLQEAALAAGDNQITQHEITLLNGFISAQRGVAGTTVIVPLQVSLTYFTKHQMTIQVSQAHLLLAWLHALENNHSQVKNMIEAVEEDIYHLKHANHLARLYQFSSALLGGWWKTKTIIQFEHTLTLYRGTRGVRVYAFGVPRIYIDDLELQQRERQQMSTKLLLYLLEKREATLWQIVTALWEDADPESGRNRFNVLMSNVKKNGIPSDWYTYDEARQMYVVQSGFPHYYDGADFNHVYQAMLRNEHPTQGLAQSLKLINLYNPFATTLEGEAFEEFRRFYEARFDQVLNLSQAFLDQSASYVPRHWHDQLLVQIRNRFP